MLSRRLLLRGSAVFFSTISASILLLTSTSKQPAELWKHSSCCDKFSLRQGLPKPGYYNPDGIHTVSSKNQAEVHHAEHESQSATPDDECGLFPNTSGLLLVMKTGASESYSRVLTQLLTNLKCVSDFIVFSDMAEKIAGHAIYDCLDTVVDEVQRHKDFDLYHRQKHCPVAQEQCNKNYDVAQEGWQLDKYKDIHMAEKAYKMRPNYDWSLKPYYIGNVLQVSGYPFGHGGSGYVVSQAAMRSMFDGKTSVANKYDVSVQNYCCSDLTWSKALKDETGIEPTHSWPVILGEKPLELSYYENNWCQPIVTMHHVIAKDISDLYDFEKEGKFTTLRVKDLYHKLIGPYLQEIRQNRDNLSEDVFYINSSHAEYEKWELDRAKTDGLSDAETQAYKSFGHCKTACLGIEGCFQFRYHNGICATANHFKHGRPVNSDDDSKSYTSGWDVKKIKRWVEEHDCDRSFQWQ